MNYQSFKNYVITLLNAMNSLDNEHEHKDAVIFSQHGLWAIHRLEKLFNDRNHNVLHWLNGESCEYYHPATKQTIKVEIGEDIEALYCFLRYCQKLNNHERIDSDSFDYLLYTITRSKNTKDWEEC